MMYLIPVSPPIIHPSGGPVPLWLVILVIAATLASIFGVTTIFYLLFEEMFKDK